MAISYDNGILYSGTGGAVSTHTFSAFTIAANTTYLVVGLVTYTDSTDSVSSVKIGGIPMTRIHSIVSVGTGGRGYLYLLPNPPTGSQVITVNLNNPRVVYGGAATYIGTTTANVVDSSNTGSSGGTTDLDLSTVTSAATTWVFSVFYDFSGRTKSGGTNTTPRQTDNASGGVMIADSNTNETPAGTFHQHGVLSSSGDYAGSIFSLAPGVAFDIHVYDYLSPVESVIVLKDIGISTSDSINISESETTVLPVNISTADSVTISDVIGYYAIIDQETITESIQFSINRNLSISETQNITENAFPFFGNIVTASDSQSITETITRNTSLPNKTVTDSETITDVVAVTRVSVVFTLDTQTQSESVLVSTNDNDTVVDSVVIKDKPIVSLIPVRYRGSPTGSGTMNIMSGYGDISIISPVAGLNTIS